MLFDQNTYFIFYKYACKDCKTLYTYIFLIISVENIPPHSKLPHTHSTIVALNTIYSMAQLLMYGSVIKKIINQYKTLLCNIPY